MATHVLTDAGIWVHDVAVHDLANSLQIFTARETQDNTRFGYSSRAMKMGLFTVQVSASGMADMDTYDEDLFDIYDNTPTTPLTVSATGGDGDVAYTFRSIMSSLQPLGGSIGDLSAVSIQADGKGGVRPVRGTILHPETARTTTGTGTAHQVGAATANQAVYAALHVVAASGTSPTLDVIVQSDDAEAMPSPTNQITFTQATGKTAEWMSASGAITDDWWRISYTIGGTDPSFTFIVVVGVAAT